jgi:hypothetical protein
MTGFDVVMLLVAALAVCALYTLARSRLESNLPLLFYIAVIALVRWSGDGINDYLLGAGVILALMLRFEFMNGPFTKLVVMLECAAVGAIGWTLVARALDLSFGW